MAIHHLTGIAEKIRDRGWAQAAQMFDEVSLSIFYTIGNYERGLPELIMIASDQDGGAILDAVCGVMRKNNRLFADGEFIETGYNFPLKALNVSDEVKEKYTPKVGDYYRTNDYALQQIVRPDASGGYELLAAGSKTENSDEEL
jgi:hypothetical protein